MKNVDVIVIGGGMIGLSIAYWLTKKDKTVLVLEKGPTLAAGSSGAGDGHIYHNTKMPGYHTNLGFAGGEMYPAILEDLGDSCGFSEHCGSYLLYNDEKEYEIVENATKKMQEGGMDIRMLSGDELRRQEPYFSKKIYGASYAPSGGKLDPLKLVFAYARKVTERGGTIICEAEVTGVIIENGAVCGVKTPKGDFYADAIVDAAGSWSGFLGKTVGLYVPVKPRKGQIVVSEGCAPMLKGPVTTASFFCAKFHPEMMQMFRKMTKELNHGTAIEQTSSGTILIGATNEWADFDKRNTVEAIEWLVTEACRAIPALRNVHFIRSFSGFRPYTPDHLPMVGSTAYLKNYYFATGFEGGGVSLNPAIGRMVSEMICGEELTITNAPLAPDRLVKPYADATEEELKANLPLGIFTA